MIKELSDTTAARTIMIAKLYSEISADLQLKYQTEFSTNQLTTN